MPIGLFSVFVDLLMLTGPLFMLQIYDRVLTSRSEAALVALIGIVAFLFPAMGLLDHARARVLARAGARFQGRVDARVMGAILTQAGRSTEARSVPATGLADRFVFSPWETGDKVITDFGDGDDVVGLLADTSADDWPQVTDILGSQTQTQAGTYVYDLRKGLTVETHVQLAVGDFEVE